MRILMLSQSLPFPIYRDGVTLRVYHLLRALSEFAQCHLIAFAEHDLPDTEMRELRCIASYDIVKEAKPSRFLGLARKILSSRRYYSRIFEEKITNAFETFRPDVLIAEQTFMSQYADAVADLPKIASAVDAISLAAFRQSAIYRNPLKRLASWCVAHQRLRIERRHFPAFDRVTVVGEYDAEYLRSRLRLPVDVIPNGVDTEYFNPSYCCESRQSIVFTGNLSASANEEACLYLLRDVFPVIHAKHRQVRLTIAGRKPTRRIKSALPPYVTLMADIPDIRDALCNALLCVSPIVYGTGIKNTVLQAMAMGVPVVTTSLIADPIQIVHGETGIVAERHEAFLTAIEKALADQQQLSEIGRNGRLHVEELYSWRHVASEYMKICGEVMRTDGSRLSSQELN